jgi:hypothetical protein
MKNLIIILISFFVGNAHFLHAQEVTFKVLVNKGKNEVKSKEGWVPVKTGTSLKSDDELKVSDNSYVGLVHVSGKSLEVKDAGKYKIIDLAKKVSGGSSVLNKYTDFILSSNVQKKNNLAATGAVTRGIKNIRINLPKPESSVVFSGKIIFDWETEGAQGPYTVVFSSMFGDELKKIETALNRVEIDLSESNFLNEDNIRIKIYAKVGPAKESNDEDYYLKRLSKADLKRIKNSLNEISDAVSEPSAINELVLAGFYESNNLLVDAITAYQEAMKLAPDVPEYKQQYNDFLLRNGIKEPPIKK